MDELECQFVNRKQDVPRSHRHCSPVTRPIKRCNPIIDSVKLQNLRFGFGLDKVNFVIMMFMFRVRGDFALAPTLSCKTVVERE